MVVKHVGFPGPEPMFLPVGLYLTISLVTALVDKERRGGGGGGGRRRGIKNIKKEEKSKRQCGLYNFDQKFLGMGLWINATL